MTTSNSKLNLSETSTGAPAQSATNPSNANAAGGRFVLSFEKKKLIKYSNELPFQVLERVAQVLDHSYYQPQII